MHAITDEQIARRADFDDVARELSVGGAERIAFHARGRGLTGLEHYDLAHRLSHLPSPLFINDRLDVALAVPSMGVQLGRGSLPVSAAREMEHRWWIGRSVHDLAEAQTAKAEGADYLVAGPVYATASHPDQQPLGLEPVRQIVGLELPVIAIGGITPERVRALRAVGVAGVAAIRAFWDAAEPALAARNMSEAWQ
jgi:thiamine-phosphate diphosphorylase